MWQKTTNDFKGEKLTCINTRKKKIENATHIHQFTLLSQFCHFHVRRQRKTDGNLLEFASFDDWLGANKNIIGIRIFVSVN